MDGFLCRNAVCRNITERAAAERVWPNKCAVILAGEEEIAKKMNLWMATVEDKADQFNAACVGERFDYRFVIFWLNRSGLVAW